MTVGTAVHPPADSWVAAVHASESDFTPLGSAVVIDDHRVLTCAHVVSRDGKICDSLWVAFPKADHSAGHRRPVASVVLPDGLVPAQDLAVLVLADAVPAGVASAPLKCPRPGDLIGHRWWAFGFPPGYPAGSSAHGLVGAALALGWVRMDSESRYQVEAGFSGGGLWSPDYQAVIGVVGQANNRGDGQAITLYQADAWLPGERLRLLTEKWSAAEAGELALAEWGWTLEGDPEAVRHWRPRARGVSVDSERGYRFRGRSAALRVINEWLDRRHPDRRALVITGSPGSGKSAVLGRIVTTADSVAALALPQNDYAVRASLGSVACAVHTKGKTALEVAVEIARAASAALPDHTEDFAAVLRTALTERGGRRFNVIIDALDEATTPAQTRIIISKIILPLAETCSDVGAQVVVGTRPRHEDGDLIAAFGESATVVDLDNRQYFSADDLTAYAMATLQLTGDERDGNPYIDNDAANALAHRIAQLSGSNYLVAGLTARVHGLHDEYVADPVALSFTATVDAAMQEYLHRLAPLANTAAEDVLTALAFAEAPGLPLDLWKTAVQALGAGRVGIQQLARFARLSAANFLVEVGGDGQGAVFRLFHQALNDALRHRRSQIAAPYEDERVLVRAFSVIGKRDGWSHAPGYLLRSLAAHASRAGMIDDLLAEDAYLLYADLRRVIPLADRASSTAGRQRARLLRLTSRAIAADPPTRAALFSVTETLEGLGRSYSTSDSLAPYRAKWSTVAPRTERSVLEGHTGWVGTICSFTLGDRTFLASGGRDEVVRTWDPVTGIGHTILEGHTSSVYTLCAFTQDGRTYLASGSDDHTLRIWDPTTGDEHTFSAGHRSGVRAVCAFTQDGRTLLATGGVDQKIRIWDPIAGTEYAVLEGHSGPVTALCAFTQDGHILLASGGDDQTVRIWDPFNGRTVGQSLRGHTGTVAAICAFTQDGRTLLASAGDRTVRIWDPEAGVEHSVLTGHISGVRAVCAFTQDGRTLLASAGDWTVRIWDPEAGVEHSVLTGHTSGVRAVCAFTQGGRTLLASAGFDRTVRIWDPDAEAGSADLTRHSDPVSAMCALVQDDYTLLAGGGFEGAVRILDPVAGTEHAVLNGHTGGVRSMCTFTKDGRILLASGSFDGTVRIWDPVAGIEHAVLDSQTGWVAAVCAFTQDGRTLLASGGKDREVRIWDPATGALCATLKGHEGHVYAVCAFTYHDGRTVIASGGLDETVRIWDPATGVECERLEGHTSGVSAVRAFTDRGRTLLASASFDGTVRIWDPATATSYGILAGHASPVYAVCTFTQDGRTFLASGSDDRTVRIWDLATKTSLLTVPVHHPARAVEHTCGLLIVAVTTGLFAIRLSPISASPQYA